MEAKRPLDSCSIHQQKRTMREAVPHLVSCYITVVIKTALYWYKHRHIDRMFLSPAVKSRHSQDGLAASSHESGGWMPLTILRVWFTHEHLLCPRLRNVKSVPNVPHATPVTPESLLFLLDEGGNWGLVRSRDIPGTLQRAGGMTIVRSAISKASWGFQRQRKFFRISCGHLQGDHHFPSRLPSGTELSQDLIHWPPCWKRS